MPPTRLLDEKDLWKRALSDAGPRDYWRSVRELWGTRLTPSGTSPEFPDGAERASTELGRRELMQLLGASVALAGLGACTQSPREKILPYAHRTPDLTPGISTYYATSMVLDGYATGLLARSHEGRPTKIEGNPEHPASLGATGVYEQASVLDLYSPGRVQAVRSHGAPASWEQAFAALPQSSAARPWFVCHPQSSPLVAAWVARVRQRFPLARFCFQSALSRGSAYASATALFGRPLDARYDFRRARVTLALGADFLASMPMSVRWARDFAERRRNAEPGADMSRLYMLEPMPTPTGSLADHRLPVRRTDIGPIAAAILAELALLMPAPQGLPRGLLNGLPRASDSPHAAWIRAVARDLAGARGQSIVIAGDTEPASTHMLAYALNWVAGNIGRSVSYSEPALIEPGGGEPLEAFVAAIQRREVDAAFILEPNVVYTSSPKLELERWLRQVPSSFHLTYFENETSRACQWVLPLSHYLESWGDARAYDGTVSFIQPLIEPLYPSKSLVEVLAACAGEPLARGHALLEQHHRTELGASFDSVWEESLKRGVLVGSASPTLAPEARWAALESALPQLVATERAPLELNLEPDPSVYDGRFAHNPWLLELPHPMTKQTWGNAALLSPASAVQLGVETGRVIELTVQDQTVEAPVLVLPGHADGVVSLSLGYGQVAPGQLGHGVGANAFRLRGEGGAFSAALSVRVTQKSESLAITQDHASLRDRPLALVTTLADYRAHPDFTQHLRGPQPTLLPVYPPSQSPQWAMTIDTSICTGCSSCVVACQAENNVPVVGKKDVTRGREMHWLRIDRYYKGPVSDPQVVNQPMLCQHCEKAPCEYVCPVNATVHSPDGLNEMVYNRCIGTRFCSNNCPYKVRRFNWFEYTDDKSTVRMQRNPDVTVRERGVMEKCTYCVQRIRRVEQTARIEKRAIQPEEVVTACQQACPTRAIQFGALQHENTPMVEWRKESRLYAALHDLGTQPRTQYLAKVLNLNPELEA